MTKSIDRTEIWIDLAKLFFGGELATQTQLDETARRLKAASWSRQATERVLVQIIAPHAKRNLGYGSPSAIGEDELLERENLLPKMLRSEELRSKSSSPLFFCLQDWNSRRLLKRLKVERLLQLL